MFFVCLFRTRKAEKKLSDRHAALSNLLTHVWVRGDGGGRGKRRKSALRGQTAHDSVDKRTLGSRMGNTCSCQLAVVCSQDGCVSGRAPLRPASKPFCKVLSPFSSPGFGSDGVFSPPFCFNRSQQREAPSTRSVLQESWTEGPERFHNSSFLLRLPAKTLLTNVHARF